MPSVRLRLRLGLDPNSMKFVEGGVALQNLKDIVEASENEVGKIVKTRMRAKRASETAYELIACPRYS